MKRPFTFNSVAVFFSVLFVIVLCTVAACYIAMENRDELGVLPTNFKIREIYRTEPWTFRLEGLLFSFPADTYVAPVYFKDRLIGITIQSSGGSLDMDLTPRRLVVEDLFIALDNGAYTQIKGETLFLPLENPALQGRIAATARSLVRLPEVQGLVFPRIFLPPPGSASVYLEKGTPISDSGGKVQVNTRPLFLFFSNAGLMVVLTIYLLTIDLHPTDALKRLHEAKPHLQEKITAALLLAVFLVAAAMIRLPAFTATSVQPAHIILYYAVFTVLLLLRRMHIISPQDFGLSNSLPNCCRGVAVVMVITSIIVLFSALRLPSGVNTGAVAAGREAILRFGLLMSYAFGAEFFWRGFLQSYLERLWGKALGLFASIFLASLPAFLIAYTSSGLPLAPEKGLEVFFFYPLTSLLIAFLYQRSHNLINAAFLHTLILFLPGFLLF